MHATYLFLVENDDIELAREAFKTWLGERGDENNWYQEVCAVNSKGNAEILCPDGDRRGRDKLAKSLVSSIRESESIDDPEKAAKKFKGQATISDLKVFAWECVAVDTLPTLTGFALASPDKEEAKIQEEMEGLNLNEWPTWYVDKALQLIKKAYGKLDTEQIFSVEDYMDESNYSSGITGYKRKKLVNSFEKVVESIRYNRAPFTESGNPYDYRAFFIPYDAEEDEESVLAVDIHT